MKGRFRLVPAFLSVVILAAHFFRMQNIPLTALSLILLPLLFVKKQWNLRIMQIFLFLGSVEWLRTMFMLVAERKDLGLPYMRMVLILGVVCLFTLCSALLLKPASFSDPESD